MLGIALKLSVKFLDGLYAQYSQRPTPQSDLTKMFYVRKCYHSVTNC